MIFPVVFVLGAVWVFAVMTIIAQVRLAPVGFEDSDGLHLIAEPDDGYLTRPIAIAAQ